MTILARKDTAQPFHASYKFDFPSYTGASSPTISLLLEFQPQNTIMKKTVNYAIEVSINCKFKLMLHYLGESHETSLLRLLRVWYIVVIAKMPL